MSEGTPSSPPILLALATSLTMCLTKRLNRKTCMTT
ncbi:hypothetical protein GBAR_LOCUS10373 [Geodia barretti]|uniref:Uncharacterized protein n=1 Tax=Geodia barretti TaxID=519541 RepID=A0AA35RSM9_GEOBA|nr:hypothetical protein GBAR_LOCUS10373 [Geodia barretti]